MMDSITVADDAVFHSACHRTMKTEWAAKLLFADGVRIYL